MKKLGIIFTLTVLLMAALAVPSLAREASADDPQVLKLRYDSVCARVDFTTGVMTDIVSLVPQASDLNAHISQLNADLVTLGGYVSAGDSSGFSSFVSGTINPDLKDAHEAMRADRAQFRAWNVTAETRQALKGMYDQRKATFEAQISSIVVQRGNLRLTGYYNAIAKYDDRMSKLSTRGVDVSGMQNVGAGAQSAVIAPLQAAVASGDAASVRAELQGKCLGNGAPYSYHFWARMDMEGGRAITARIADNATQAGYGEQIAAINGQLDTVKSALDSTGTNPYTVEQQNTIWNSLKSAAEQLRSLIAAPGGH